MMENGDEPIILRRSEEDDEGVIEAKFLDVLIERQAKAAKVKKEILSPIFEQIDKYKKCHYQFYESVGLFCGKLVNTRKETVAAAAAAEMEDNDEIDDEIDNEECDVDEEEEKMQQQWQQTQSDPQNFTNLLEGASCSFCSDYTMTEIDLKRQAVRNLEIVKCWDLSLWGKLEQRLSRLITRYCCLAFNGSR
jgi:hypothetical protein